jgi:hypothetical protein
MKTLLTIAALLLTLTASAQTATKDANGNYHAAHRADTTSNKPTGKTFTDNKGKVYPVYESSRGKLYYIRISKTGNQYKAYINI